MEHLTGLYQENGCVGRGAVGKIGCKWGVDSRVRGNGEEVGRVGGFQTSPQQVNGKGALDPSTSSG